MLTLAKLSKIIFQKLIADSAAMNRRYEYLRSFFYAIFSERRAYAMAVFRVEKNKGYTVMSNHHLRNESLTLKKAKGLLSNRYSS